MILIIQEVQVLKTNIKIKPKWKCYHCGKEGHIKKYCYDYIRKQKQESSAFVATESKNACLSEVLTVSSSTVFD